MLTIDTSEPTTVHPVMPVEPPMKLVKPPTGTEGVSKLPSAMSFARAADAAKTRINIVKQIFRIRMSRNAFAERGQTVVGRSELLGRVQSWDPPSIKFLIGPLASASYAFANLEHNEFASRANPSEVEPKVWLTGQLLDPPRSHQLQRS